MFQYRVVVDGVSSKMRTVEERIVTIVSQNAYDALAEIKRNAYQDQTRYINNEGNEVFIEFVGVMDFIELGIECSENDVWYEIKTMRKPMERKEQLIPKECDLPAIKLLVGRAYCPDKLVTRNS